MKFAATPPYDGTLATFYKVPEECCFVLPPSLSLEEAALVEPMAVAVHCCKLGKVSPGKRLVIFGAGAIGLLCGAVAKAFGATNVLLVDVFQDRIDFAKEHLHLDAQIWSADTPDDEQYEILQKQLGTPNTGADVVVEASGSPLCMQRAVAILSKGGTIVQVGLGMNLVQFPMGDLCVKEATLRGSFRYGPGDYATAISLLGSGRVDVKPLISKTYPFENAEAAFRDSFEKKGIKQVIYGPAQV
ncbi:Endo-1,4-beta-xylanase 2 [Lecanicillium sp. MT-2017a]|nr:Endo-1,4-beta-xylanase 2 [Lecanicillium sp. MT-2017a]